MTIRTINWCTDERLDCQTALPSIAFLCIPVSIVNPPQQTIYGIIIGTVLAERPSTCADPCGPCKWVYTLQYEDSQLIPGHLLVQSSIIDVLCSNCILDFVINFATRYVCVEDSETIDLSKTVDGCVKADLKISADVNNCIESRVDGLFVPCSPLFSIVETINVNDPTVQTIQIPSSSYILINNQIGYFLHATATINNAVIDVFTDPGMTNLFISQDFTGGYFGVGDIFSSGIAAPTKLNTATTLYVRKTVLEGSDQTIDLAIIGYNV